MTDRKTPTRAEKALARMKAQFPAAFPRPPRPLKVGVREDLIAAGFTASDVAAALTLYMDGEPYLRSIQAEGAFRIDLKGHPVAPVQDYEREFSRGKLLGKIAEATSNRGLRKRA